MQPIGGYFELEVGSFTAMRDSSGVAVNFGRGGLELIIKTRGYKCIWMPDYNCTPVQTYVENLGCECKIYNVSSRLEPVKVPKLQASEALLYINYFGVKDVYCRYLESNYDQLILDLSLAYYYQPLRADGFNSCRKFFGVPDGGFVFGKDFTDVDLSDSISYDVCESLLKRADGDIAGGYEAFHAQSKVFAGRRMAKMSRLTKMLLSSCDVQGDLKRRNSNFTYLSKHLNCSNELDVDLNEVNGALIYPYLVRGGNGLRQKLVRENVFCPTYWPNIANPGEVAQRFLNDLVCIPIDQRYTTRDMSRILEIING